MDDDLDIRRRRAAYRAAHRGTKEMDIMLGRYADATLPTLADPDLDVRKETMRSLQRTMGEKLSAAD